MYLSASTQYIQEKGVIFQFDGERVAFRGTLTTVSADNLAAWSIGVFKALTSAFRKINVNSAWP